MFKRAGDDERNWMSVELEEENKSEKREDYLGSVGESPSSHSKQSENGRGEAKHAQRSQAWDSRRIQEEVRQPCLDKEFCARGT